MGGCWAVREHLKTIRCPGQPQWPHRQKRYPDACVFVYVHTGVCGPGVCAQMHVHIDKHIGACICVCSQSVFPDPGTLVCHVQLFETPWTIAHQDPLSLVFSRQENWSAFPFPSQGIFLTQGLNPGLLHCRQILYCLSH